jgi:hypothetical protein
LPGGLLFQAAAAVALALLPSDTGALLPLSLLLPLARPLLLLLLLLGPPPPPAAAVGCLTSTRFSRRHLELGGR